MLEKTNLTKEEINTIVNQTKLSTKWINEQKQNTIIDNTFDTNIILEKIRKDYGSIQQAVNEKSVYFRISLLSKCNKTCDFCHSEGGHANIQIDFLTLVSILEASRKNGVKKIQFTGGEPLIYKHFGSVNF